MIFLSSGVRASMHAYHIIHSGCVDSMARTQYVGLET